MKKRIANGAKSFNAAMKVYEYIRKYPGKLDAKLFAYINNDKGEVISALKANG